MTVLDLRKEESSDHLKGGGGASRTLIKKYYFAPLSKSQFAIRPIDWASILVL